MKIKEKKSLIDIGCNICLLVLCMSALHMINFVFQDSLPLFFRGGSSLGLVIIIIGIIVEEFRILNE